MYYLQWMWFLGFINIMLCWCAYLLRRICTIVSCLNTRLRFLLSFHFHQVWNINILFNESVSNPFWQIIIDFDWNCELLNLDILTCFEIYKLVGFDVQDQTHSLPFPIEASRSINEAPCSIRSVLDLRTILMDFCERNHFSVWSTAVQQSEWENWLQGNSIVFCP